MALKFDHNLDFLEGAKLSLANAKTLFETAKYSASQENFGLATSLAVLAAEEGIKSFLCFQKYNLPDQEIDQFDKIFKRHEIKHDQIVQALLYMKKSVAETSKKLPVLQKLLKIQLKSANVILSESDENQLDIEFQKLMKAYEEQFPFSENDVVNWWKKANNAKNNGLYVGINGAKWQTPAHEESSFYLLTLQFAQTLLHISEAVLGLILIKKIFDMKIRDNV